MSSQKEKEKDKRLYDDDKYKEFKNTKIIYTQLTS